MKVLLIIQSKHEVFTLPLLSNICDLQYFPLPVALSLNSGNFSLWIDHRFHVLLCYLALLGLIFLIDMILIYEHLFQSHGVPGLIEFLQLSEHFIHLANPFISEDLVPIQLPVDKLVGILFFMLEVEAGVDDVLACQSLHFVGVLLLLVFLIFVMAFVEGDLGVLSRCFGGGTC